MDASILRHYAEISEVGRLDSPHGQVEFLRTKDILARQLPASPARILDLGGGPGRYAHWLTELGHRVTLVDAAEKHVTQAREAGLDAELGDARELRFAEGSFDAVLMLGPLYHLPERAERITAWHEAARVSRGCVAVAGISRFASLHDGMRLGLDADPAFRSLIDGDLEGTGHRPPEDAPQDWFTTAYFHHPEELAAEAREAGLTDPVTYAVEGASWLFGDEVLAERLADPGSARRLLESLRRVETEPALLGASAHLLTVAYPSGQSPQ